MFCDANPLFSPDLNSHHRLPYDVIRWVTNAHITTMYMPIALPIRSLYSITRAKYYPILKPPSYVYIVYLHCYSTRRPGDFFLENGRQSVMQ